MSFDKLVAHLFFPHNPRFQILKTTHFFAGNPKNHLTNPKKFVANPVEYILFSTDGNFLLSCNPCGHAT